MAPKLLLFMALYRWPWRLLIIFCSFAGALLGLLGPYFQKHFIDALLSVPGIDILGFESHLSPIMLVLMAFICLVCSQALYFFVNFLGMREATLIQQILAKDVYQKTITLRPDSLQGKTVGEIVSIYAVDVMGSAIFLEQTLPTGAAIIFPLVLAPLGLKILFQMPLTQILWVIGAVVTINCLLALRQAVFFTRFKQLAADRLGVVNEWVINIKALKILGWLTPFENKIHKLRVRETNNRISMVTNGQTMNSLSSTVTFIINVVAIYILVHERVGTVTPGELLSLLWILGIFLTRPFRQLPWFFTFALDGWTSLKRIGDFLVLKNQGREISPLHSFEESPLEVSGPKIEVKNLRLKIGDQWLLSPMSFVVERGEFLAIVGEVGSGKSLLLLSLMGETGADLDIYRINDRDVLHFSQDELCRHFSYVPQEGFVMSANLRDNIAFDYNVNPKLDSRILNCLSLSQFQMETESLPDQLDTEIGERGVNLSGGQKQRVNIARADYYDCPVILLDDALSALDVNTEKQLIHDLVKGRWASKTRILATHRLSVLKKVDRILFLENGKIDSQGSLESLLKTSSKFKKFIETLEIEKNHGA